LSLPALAGARTVALYAGLAAECELDPRLAGPARRARGFVPVYPGVARRRPPRLAFRIARSLAELIPGPLGLLQPSPDAEEVPLDRIDAFVVPGGGFTADRARIGQGGGYYDATLAEAPRALRVGYTHPEQ